MDELSETVRVWAVHTYMHMYQICLSSSPQICSHPLCAEPLHPNVDSLLPSLSIRLTLEVHEQLRLVAAEVRAVEVVERPVAGLASQRHPGKFPKVPGRRRGTRGLP